MFFLQAAQAPVPVRIENKVFYVPKMTMDEMVNWGIELVTRRVEMITQDMDESKKAEHLSFYPITAPNLQEMSLQVRSIEGIQKVVRQCFSNPNVKGFQVDAKGKHLQEIPRPSEQEIEEWIVNSGVGRLAALAWELADMKDVSQVNPNPSPNADRSGAEGNSTT